MIKEQVPTYSINFSKHVYKAALICWSEANLNEKIDRKKGMRIS